MGLTDWTNKYATARQASCSKIDQTVDRFRESLIKNRQRGVDEAVRRYRDGMVRQRTVKVDEVVGNFRRGLLRSCTPDAISRSASNYRQGIRDFVGL